MNFFAHIDLKPLPMPITHQHKLLLIGSCFTEHIGNNLSDLKFNILQNPNGILFETESVARSLVSYIQNKQYTAADLFQYNELWQSWNHHSRFSNPSQEAALAGINQSQTRAHSFLKDADWLIITLGSSFVYKLNDEARFVANCHKAPAQWFTKHLLPIDEQIALLDNTIHQLFHFNPKLKIIFTISPVRHLRDGVVENNRSKARLLETVHHLVNKFDRLFYFPAYELVIDVLRDYRFYDIDLAHPNYAATQFVMDKFSECAFTDATKSLIKDIKQVVTAKNHKAFHPDSKQHEQFLRQHYEKTLKLLQEHPHLDLQNELKYFKPG
ncbi:GSCFA domain-containing protein [Lacibacter luteus]|uniref:GSCFA domain-containing protein n=1 Tax=Lacibacter luteus TaxID=2508719 RepID=A0A4Q1CKP1_9BACT|nr:GSCFA domain-containing protein [Lacibacter luteus]RXK61480.1 GSCFA domain-containing protein [Lacibacter luteus]